MVEKKRHSVALATKACLVFGFRGPYCRFTMYTYYILLKIPIGIGGLAAITVDLFVKRRDCDLQFM